MEVVNKSANFLLPRTEEMKNSISLLTGMLHLSFPERVSLPNRVHSFSNRYIIVKNMLLSLKSVHFQSLGLILLLSFLTGLLPRSRKLFSATT